MYTVQMLKLWTSHSRGVTMDVTIRPRTCSRTFCYALGVHVCSRTFLLFNLVFHPPAAWLHPSLTTTVFYLKVFLLLLHSWQWQCVKTQAIIHLYSYNCLFKTLSRLLHIYLLLFCRTGKFNWGVMVTRPSHSWWMWWSDGFKLSCNFGGIY